MLEDLELDLNQGARGLPQVLGRKKSIAVMFVLVVLGVSDMLFGLFRDN